MKNRQKFTVSEKSLLNKIERFDRDVDKKFLELRAKKKIVSNPLIQKNILFLQTYNTVFSGGPSHYSGDADSFFRKSLRSYSDSLDIIRDLHLQSSPLLKNKKGKKQRSALTQHHHCEDHKPLLKPEDFTEKRPKEEVSDTERKTSIKELFTKSIPEENFESSTESEDKEYFSPLEEFQSDSAYNKGRRIFQEEVKDDPEVYLEASENLEDKKEEERRYNKDFSERSGSKNISLRGFDETSISEEELIPNPINMAEEFDTEEMDDEEFQQFEMEGEGDDELKDVEQMIQQASEELQKVAEENQQMMETLEEGQEDEDLVKVTEGEDKGKPGEAAGDGSYFKFDPAIDAAVLKELEEAEKQAKATAKVITELKDRVGELLQKEKMTEAEAKELEEKNKTLKAQMMLFEEKTKRIQFLLGQANLFDKMIPVQPPLQTKHAEDILPKMLVCGVADDFMPKIVLCQNQGKGKCRSRSASQGRGPSGLSPIARKLDESYYMQERLVNENADLEGNRYKLQSDLINKDQTVECLQRQLCSVQNEMRMVYQENAMLNEQIQGCPNPSCPKNSRSNSPGRGGGMSCGPGRGPCPADVESRLQEYSNTTNQLEKQLVDVEQEVRFIHQELLEVQKEREHLEHHRKMLALQPPPCPAKPCPPYPCMPPPCGHAPCPPGPCPRPPPSCCPPEASGDDQQVKEMKEKYKRLQEDFKAKVTEIASLRTDNEKLKEIAEKAEECRIKLELKVKELEKKLKEFRGEEKGSSKEQLIDMQQQLKVHKELYRQAQDELEELRALVEDIQGQLNDYRNKYLEAIQTVEEQRRQIEIMRMENNRISEQVNLEIMRVKNQFQEKLQELAPLPDILKATQVKLQEAQQMHLLAERNNEALARELQAYKDKLQAIEEELALSADYSATGAGEKAALNDRIADLERMLQESKEENDDLRIDMDQVKEIAEENEKLANEKLHEITQLESQLESIREDSARQISRIKDRCEIVRKSMQNQINDLERQLAQTKAGAKAAEKERDDIRQKMQAQIRNLNENFEDAQMRIRNLQGHVNFLRNTGPAPNELGTVGEGPTSRAAKMPTGDPCCCSADY